MQHFILDPLPSSSEYDDDEEQTSSSASPPLTQRDPTERAVPILEHDESEPSFLLEDRDILLGD